MTSIEVNVNQTQDPTIVEVLANHAQQIPAKIAFTFANDTLGNEAETLSFGQLFEDANNIAAHLSRLATLGQRAILFYPPGLAYVRAFFGCLIAGVIAVPAYPPRVSARNDRNLERVLTVLKDAGPTLALTTTELFKPIQLSFEKHPALGRLTWVITDTVEQAASSFTGPKLTQAHIAFLQYTSGSTGSPKGVIISHGNLMANEAMITHAFGTTPASINVGWLPLYHDMGLIGNIINPVYVGYTCHLMSPVAFLQRPYRWLEAITRYKASVSGGPNFAYEICTKRISAEQRAQLDLSSWTLAFNGSEPIRAETLTSFSKAFSEQGFTRKAFFLCYGMAETTLMVSGSDRFSPPTSVTVGTEQLTLGRLQPPEQGEPQRTFVSSGQIQPNETVYIVDPDNQRRLPGGRIGELWVAGDSVALGYWQKQEATRDLFHAYTSDTNEGPFLRSGDLGCLKNGELFITGRIKELIIIRGRNHYPQDIEATVSASHQALRADGAAAFTLEENGEAQLVVVQEVERTHLRHLDQGAISEQVRAAIAEVHHLKLHRFLLIKPMALPRTTSGKIRRREAQRQFQEALFETVGLSNLSTMIRQPASLPGLPDAEGLAALTEIPRRLLLVNYLKALLATLLRIDPAQVNETKAINSLGLDSLNAIDLQHHLYEVLGVDYPMEELLEGPTPTEMAVKLANEVTNLAKEEVTPEAQPQGPAPLSANQRALWFLHKMAPNSSAYHIALPVRLGKAVVLDALLEAFNLLRKRHPALRTVFLEKEGQPMQQNQEEGEVEYRLTNAEGWSRTALKTSMAESVAKPMSLEQKPPFHLDLYQWNNEFVMQLVIHHLLADMWSLVVLFEELGTTYTTLVEGRPYEPPPEQLNYHHFVARQQQRLSGEVGDRLWAYWKKNMADKPAILRLHTDKPRPAVQTYKGAAHSFNLGTSLNQQLRALSHRHGTTLFTTLLATWQVLLHRYSGAEDLCVASPSAGRQQHCYARVIGDFVNPVVFRSDLRGNPRFDTYLSATNQVVLAGLAHQEFPIDTLVERVCPERDLTTTPLFQTLFSLQKPHLLPGAATFVLGYGETRLRLGKLNLAPWPAPVRAAQVDISLVVADDSALLPARIVYNSDLFEPTTIAAMANHLIVLAEHLAQQPETTLAHLNLLSQAEREHLFTHRNNINTEFPPKLWHQLFEETAAKCQDKIALIYGQELRMTYGQLNRQANRLAMQLRSLGAGPEQPVALCLGRHPRLLVALLATLKAGACYLPLDPNYPPDRIRYVLNDAAVSVLITEPELAQTYKGSAQHLLTETEAPTYPEQNPKILSTPQNLAYLIYTSGTTGKPKGVQLSHHSLVNLLKSMSKQPGLSQADTLLAVTTISFDIAGLELFLPLQMGAQLVLASDPESVDGQMLLENIDRNQVTVMQGTPAIWRLLLDEGLKGPLKVLCGGEALTGRLAADLTKVGIQLYNMYGPTETTIWSLVRSVPQQKAQSAVEALGEAIENTQIQVLDRKGQLQPIGIPGELCIGGLGLARGYYKQPANTALKFVPDPYSSRAGTRLYRTGDLVCRRRSSTHIDFLGRLDHQVKLRGYRIELTEIEKVLTSHDQVSEAAVAIHEDRPGNPSLVAWLATPSASPLNRLTEEPVKLAAEMRETLSKALPSYMIPTAYVLIKAMPLTPNGKVDRRALPAPVKVAKTGATVPRTGVEATIAAIWKELLSQEQIGLHDNFFDLGGHSMLMAKVNNRLKQELDQPLTMVEMFQYPTIATLAKHIRAGKAPEIETTHRRKTHQFAPIAILAVAGRFPGAENVEAYWQNLVAGKESIEDYSHEQLQERGVDQTLLDKTNYVRRGSTLKGIEQFDAHFFDYSPREARLIDPQQRVFLEISWEVMERAGYNPETYNQPVGVYAGSGMNTYLYNNRQDLLKSEGAFQLMFASDKDFLATRVAYKMNLSGPAINLQTACSTSLVAVHEASQALRAGECDMALAGGSTIRVPSGVGYLYQEGLILSTDGHCRAFDKEASGTVSASGAGVVLLKRMDDALADHDTLMAVIKGTALNNDGAAKVGYTAPSVQGQTKVIRAAQVAAGIKPETITYVEAHGTGTRLGDPIEIAALTAAFRTDKKSYCAVGSVKTNIGHLDTAAGIAGLIKIALSLQHGKLPPTLNYKQPNPEIEFENSPFYVNDTLRDWQSEGPRRAGISSFGIGGTNAHAVLEEAPPPLPRPAGDAPRAWQLILLSARAEPALDSLTDQIAETLESQQSQLADVAYTLQVGRKLFENRRAILVQDRQDAVRALRDRDPKRTFTRRDDQKERPVVFMFPGQGAQYPNMGRELYDNEKVYRQEVDRCIELLKPHLEIREILYPEPAAEAAAAERLAQTQNTQPALFVMEYAMARLLQSWGIHPQSMIGHSVGEYVAATLAGVFELEDALSLVAARGKLIAQQPAGDMITVNMSQQEAETQLEEGLSLAAVNAPALSVISGEPAKVKALSDRLSQRGEEPRQLRTSHAFHSAMMDPILQTYKNLVSTVVRKPPQIPYISNLTGTWISAEQAVDPNYWTAHLRRTVQFAKGIETLSQEEQSLLLEVGPGRGLTTLVARNPSKGEGRLHFNTSPAANNREDGLAFLQTTLGKLWLSGVNIDWTAYRGNEQRSRVVLPSYPYQKQRYWVEQAGQSEPAAEREEGRKQDMADWFYMPTWKRTVSTVARQQTRGEPGRWLLMLDDRGVAAALARHLEQAQHQVITVVPGSDFARQSENHYSLRAKEADDYVALMDLLKAKDQHVETIVHAWNITGKAAPVSNDLTQNFYSLLYLAKALARDDEGQPNRRLHVITDGMQDVTGEGIDYPNKATVLGTIKVIGQELKHVTCKSIDIAVDDEPAQAGEHLYTELSSLDTSPVVAQRGRTRWTRLYDPIRLEPVPQQELLQKGGTYLITGGLGGLGLEVATYLAQEYQAKLVLSGRKAQPERQSWDAILREQPNGPEAARIATLRKLEQQGATVAYHAADVADEGQMRAMLEQARQQFGKIDGVFHAAGVASGSAIVNRDDEGAEGVMAAKVTGTLVLERLLREEPPAFMLLFSSVNAILGGFGQIDYAAANAFMDAYATSRQGQQTFVVSINWDSWREVGMAAAALRQQTTGGADPKQEPLTEPHPLFDGRSAGKDEMHYHSRFNIDQHWTLHEHWILGRAILPGTTYLEMARAAFEDRTGKLTVAFRDVMFLAPMIVAQGETRATRTILKQKGTQINFRVESRIGKDWIEHCHGEMWPLEREQQNLGELRATTGMQPVANPLEGTQLGEFKLAKKSRELDPKWPRPDGKLELIAITDQQEPPTVTIELGPRWQTVREVYLGENQALALMTLSETYAADLSHYKLHPGLLDFAVGYMRLYKGMANYLPLSYQRLHQYAPLPARIYSHVTLVEGWQTGKGNPSFEIKLLDEAGQELVVIEQFTLGKIEVARLEAQPTGAQDLEEEAFTVNWLSPTEGIGAMERVLGATLPSVVVSTTDLQKRLQDSSSAQMIGGLHGAAQREKHARPDLMTAYVQPRSEDEKKLAEIWQDVIAVEKVGIHDDFNDLGGDSLLITQIHAKMKQEFRVEVSVAELMQYPNISDLLAFMNNKSKPETQAKEKQQMRDRAAKQKQSMNKAKRNRTMRRKNPMSRKG